MKSESSVRSSYRWVVFGLLGSAYLLVHFHRLSTAVVAVDLMHDLGAGGTVIGLLASAYFYPYAFMQLPTGLLADSWGPRRTVTFSFALAGLASIFFGLAGSIWWAILARALVGLGVAMLFVPTLKILTQWFKRSDFAMMTGILMGLGGVGALASSSPLAWLSARIGWRGSFEAIGVVTSLLAVAIWVLVRNRPEDMGLPPAEIIPEAAGTSPAVPLLTGLKMVLTRPAFWPLAIWFAANSGLFFAFGGLWGGPYLIQVYGLSKAEAGQIMSMFAISIMLGSPLLSYLSDRVLKSRKKPIMGVTLFSALVVAVFVFFPAGLPRWALYLGCLVLGASGSSIVVVAFASTKELFPTNIVGTALGTMNIFPFLGGALLQLLVGYLLDVMGPVGGPYAPQVFSRAFLPLLVAALVALASSTLMKETVRASRSVGTHR